VDDFDLESFEIIDNFFARDKNNVYFNERAKGGSLFIPLDYVDAESFERLYPSYIKDKNAVYYLNTQDYGLVSTNIEKVELAEVDSFEVLSKFKEDYTPRVGYYPFYKHHSYAKDKNNVFFDGKIITGSDPKTFVIFNDKYPGAYLGYYCSDGVSYHSSDLLHYAGDKNAIYCGDKIFQNGDIKSFKRLFNEIYKDKNNIYCQDMILESADPDTIERLKGSSFHKDKYRVYNSSCEVIQEGNPEDFDINDYLEDQ
jgi:hypothetical protein